MAAEQIDAAPAVRGLDRAVDFVDVSQAASA
jgi:hypothetical protein